MTVPVNQRLAIKDTQHQLPIFCQHFQFFCCKIEICEKIKWHFLILGVTNIRFVLRFMKSNTFYYFKIAKVVNSKDVSGLRWGIFAHFSNSNFLVIKEDRNNWLRIIGSFLMFLTTLASLTEFFFFFLCVYFGHIFFC